MMILHGRSPLVVRNAALPSPTATLKPLFIEATTPFALLATVFYCARIYSRMVPARHLYWDDYLITLGFICAMATWGLGLALESVTGARHIEYVSLDNVSKGLHLFYIAQFFTFYSNLLIKASMCAMLLRIFQTTLWKVGLWILLTTLALIAIATSVTNVIECSPPSAYWNIETHYQSCWSTPKIVNIGLGLWSYFILTDFILALLPIVFIRQLRRPLRDKIVLTLLMGCGLVATGASITKAISLYRVSKLTDLFYGGVRLAIFSLLELFLGIIASCAPCLKSLWDRVLRRLGFQLSTRTNPKNRYFVSSGPDGMKQPPSARSRPAIWEGPPQDSSMNTDATAVSESAAPREKDVIVKKSYVSWECTSA